MNHLELVREATRIAHHIRAEGDIDYSDLFPDADTEDVAALYLAADEWRKTADLVAKVVAAYLEGLLSNRSVEVGGTLLWRGESKREVCVDREGFWGWARTVEIEALRKVFNEDYARKGALPPTVRDMFFEKQSSGKVELQYAPIEVIETARQRKVVRSDYLNGTD